MSEHSSGRYDYDSYGGAYSGDPVQQDGGSTAAPVSLELDLDIRTGDRGGGGGGGGGGDKASKKPGMTLEERARVLAPTEPQQSLHGPPSAQPPPTPSYPPATYQSTPPPKTPEIDAFHVQNAYVAPQTRPVARNHNDPWVAAGSLKPLENEEVIMRRAGALTDVLNLYQLVSYIMLTNRRVVIKQSSRFLGFNLFTVESSFLYSNLRHITIARITNFKYLWIGIGLFLLGIALCGSAAVVWFYALMGVLLILGSVFPIYWFFIFYNSNAVVIDFSKGELVGTWGIGRAKASFITKALVLHIDHCFEVMYAIYENSRTVFSEESNV